MQNNAQNHPPSIYGRNVYPAEVTYSQPIPGQPPLYSNAAPAYHGPPPLYSSSPPHIVGPPPLYSMPLSGNVPPPGFSADYPAGPGLGAPSHPGSPYFPHPQPGMQALSPRAPYDPYNVRQSYLVPQTMVPVWRKIMSDDILRCCDDFPSCVTALIFPACLASITQSKLGSSCVGACICFPCCCGCQRSNVQISLGVSSPGCCINCCVVACCMPCAISQEARAVNAWVLAGKPAPQAVPSAPQMR